MPKQQLKTRLFGQNETLDDLTAEQEELGEPATPPESPAPEPPAEAPPAEPPAVPEPEPPPAQETRADKRIRELLEGRANLERQLAESNERWARLDERRKQVQEAQGAAAQAAQQQRDASERPDPNIDPVGARLYDIQKQNEQLLAWKQQQEQNFAQLQQTVQQSQQANDFNNWIVAEAQRYTNTQPDYPQAVEYLGQQRLKFWMDVGYPPEQARQIVMSEAMAVANGALQSRKSFPDIFYNLAKQWGYQTPNGHGNGNGAPASVPTPAAASNAARVLNQVRAGQAMQGLSRAPSAGAPNTSRYRDMTAAEISAVSERQWQRDWANPALRADMEYALRKLDQLDDQEISYQGRG